MKEMYDNKQHVEDTFNESNLAPYLKHAQWSEFTYLQQVIAEIFRKNVGEIRLLDIGVGDGRVLKEVGQVDELWSMIAQYDAIDIAQNCVAITSKVIEKYHLQDKAKVILRDACHLDQLEGKYDLIVTTWFTAGNFYPKHYSVETFEPGFDMTENKTFTDIFQKAYDKLNPGGEIVIGSMYIDNKNTRRLQEDSYRHFGWEVITDERDCFTASKEGWWSQRFTKDRVFSYLPFVPKENISFTPLDPYNYAMMVRIKKQ